MDMPTAASGKSFWFKKDSYAAWLVLGGLAFAGIWFWGIILPFLIGMLVDTIHLAILAAVVGVILFCLLDNNIRTGVWYLFKMASRAFTGLVVNIDPIAILHSYISDLEEKRAETSKKIDEVTASEEKLKKQIETNNFEIEKNRKMYAKGQEMGKPEAALAEYSILAGGLIDMNKNLAPMRDKIDKVRIFLEKMYESSGYLITQMNAQVRLKEIEYTAIKSANKAMKSALSIFQGDPDKKAMFDMAIDHIADDMATKVGEMKRAMDMSTSFLDGVDLEKGIAADSGKAAMVNFDPAQFSIIRDAQPVAIPHDFAQATLNVANVSGSKYL